MANPTVLTTGFLAIGTAYQAGVLTELAGNGYARQPITLTYDPVAGAINALQGVTFGPATGTLAAGSFFAVFDSLAGGNLLLAWGTTTAAQSAGTSLTVQASAITGSFTAGLLAALPVSLAAQRAIGTIGAASPVTLNAGVALTISTAYAMTVTGSVYVPSTQPAINFRNLIDGGDFTINPWQRNIPGLASGGVISTAVANTVTYFADRFFAVGGASSAILMANVANTTVAGFNAALQWGRQSSNANTAVINLGQVLETADTIRMQGLPVTFSFWAAAGANLSAAGNAINVSVVSGTGSNQSAASAVAGTWTGQTTVASGTAVLTTTMQRFQFIGTVPAGCTQLAVLINYTPVGTAGANDNASFMGFQLEPGLGASPFEHRDIQVELEICQRYALVIPEPASGVYVASGNVSATNTENFIYTLPVQMRIAPTVTTSVGTFKSNSSTAGVVAATGLTGNAVHTTTVIGLNATGTATAGQAAQLQGGGGTGWIQASADF